MNSFLKPVLLMTAVFATLVARAGSCFERYYRAGTPDQAVHFTRATDGSFLLAGSSWDSLLAVNRYFLLHVDSGGTPLFDTTFSTSFQTYARAVTALPDGRFAMVGTRIGFFYDAVTEVHLLDSAARPANAQVYPPFDGWGTSGIGVFTARDSSICVTHFTDGFLSSNFISMMNLDADLSVRWTAFLAYDGGEFNEHSAVQCEDGTFLTTAFFQDYWYAWPDVLNATELRTVTETGDQRTDSIYVFGMESTSIACGPGKRTLICGRTDSTGLGDGCTVVLDSAGNLIQRRCWGDEFYEDPVQLVSLPDSGWAVLSDVASPRFPGKHDLRLTRFNAAGDSLWSRRFGGPANDQGMQLMALSDGGFAFLGIYDDAGLGRIYFVRTDANGLVQTDFRVAGDTSFTCAGDTVLLVLLPTPPAGSQIVWNSGELTDSIRVVASGIYQATVTPPGSDAVLTNTFPLYIAPLPEASLGLQDTVALCSKTVLSLAGTQDPTYTFTWFRNDTLLEGEQVASYTPEIPGVYMTIVGNYCGTDTARVNIDSLYRLPDPPFVTADRANPVCPGDSVRLFVPSGAVSTEWYRFDGSEVIFISGATDTTYTALENSAYGVRITDQNACSVLSDPYRVEYDNEPYFVNANGPISFCSGGQVQLTAGPGSDYRWSTGDSSQSVLVDATGQFSYTCLSPAGCAKQSDTLQVTVLALPVIDLGPDTVLCDPDTLFLDAGNGFLFYQWSDGSSSQFFQLPFTAEGDTIQLAAYVTDTNYCSDGDTLQVLMAICNGIEEQFAGSGLSVFPNPVTHGRSEIQVTLPTNLQGGGVFTLYTAEGRLLAALGTLPASGRLLLPAVSAGVYFLIYTENNRISTARRIVVE